MCYSKLMEIPSLSLKDTGRIYLDHNATTPPLDSVRDSVLEWLDAWGNPSSIHWSGRSPKNLIRQTRQRMAQHLRCHPLELSFTSGGSEANNMIIKGFFENLRRGRLHSERNEYITTEVEHPSVLQAFADIELLGARVHYLKVNRDGIIDLNQYEKILSDRTALVSVMFANNETGSQFPLKKMVRMASSVGARFHTDAVQTLGKQLLDINSLGVHFASFSGHKVYSLKGVGVVFIKKGERIAPLVSGGGQERGRRAGTENTLAIASLGKVLEGANTFSDRIDFMKSLRDKMDCEIMRRISKVSLTGAGAKRLCNTSSFVFENIDGESLLMNLDLLGISVSTGAACSSGNPEPSPVLLAMGLSRSEAQGSLRVSIGWGTTEAEIDRFIDVLVHVIDRLRNLRQTLERQILEG